VARRISLDADSLTTVCVCVPHGQAHNARRNTALHFAHELGWTHIQAALLSHGAHQSKAKRNAQGLSPLDLTPSHILGVLLLNI